MLHMDCKQFTEGEGDLFVDREEAGLLLPAAAIELERLSQPLARFERVRLALKHDVLRQVGYSHALLLRAPAPYQSRD